MLLLKKTFTLSTRVHKVFHHLTVYSIRIFGVCQWRFSAIYLLCIFVYLSLLEFFLRPKHSISVKRLINCNPNLDYFTDRQNLFWKIFISFNALNKRMNATFNYKELHLQVSAKIQKNKQKTINLIILSWYTYQNTIKYFYFLWKIVP